MSATVTARYGAGLGDAAEAARSGDRRRMVIIALQQVFFGIVPVIMFVGLLEVVITSRGVALDFSNAYWTAGARLLHGGNPYYWTHTQLAAGVSFVYPALSAIAFVPFALLSRGTADDVFTLICVSMVPLTLWALRVRDWRVYGITLVWGPVFTGWQSGNETLPLIALCALVWRWRDKPARAGILTAIMVSLKPFVWPLALWLLLTRRWRASVWSLAAGVVINLATWSIVGFGRIPTMLHVSNLDTAFAWRGGYSVDAVAHHLGLSHHAGDVLTLVAAVALIGALFYVGYVKGRERHALTFAILLMLVASPLLWSHYFALLVIPMAINRPRMSWLWLLPLAMWACPPSYAAVFWQDAVAWAVAGTMFVACIRDPGPPSRRVVGARPQALAHS